MTRVAVGRATPADRLHGGFIGSGWRARTCPTCGVGPGRSCLRRMPAGYLARQPTPHAARRATRTAPPPWLGRPCPDCRAPAGAFCVPLDGTPGRVAPHVARRRGGGGTS